MNLKKRKKKGDDMKTIKQNITIKASPHEVYETLMDSRKHSQLTGDKAKIDRKVGGKFTVFRNYADGKNLELVQDKKIVQTWHASDWPNDHYSKITFLLKPVKDGTLIKFTQIKVPDEFYKDISQGWYDYYWKPMKKMLEK